MQGFHNAEEVFHGEDEENDFLVPHTVLLNADQEIRKAKRQGKNKPSHYLQKLSVLRTRATNIFTRMGATKKISEVYDYED